jgi:hypothetical protein
MIKTITYLLFGIFTYVSLKLLVQGYGTNDGAYHQESVENWSSFKSKLI